MSESRPRRTVAVIIPYYDGSKWIERAVKSVCNQSVPADELIIVNDGSRTDEQTFIYELAKRYPLTIIDKTNGGQGSARNAGVAASKSEYISFLDQDDFYLPNHIEDLVDALPEKDRRFGFLYADLCVGDENGNIIFADTVRWRGPHPKRSVIDLLARDMYVLPSASLICRKAFEAVGGFDPQFTGYEDDDLFLRLFRAGYSNYFVDKSVTVWCTHAASTSYSILMLRSRFLYFKKLTASFPDDPAHGLYFFRDCIAPRFGVQLVRNAIEAAKNRSEHREEINAMLREYRDIILANEHVKEKYKAHIKRITFLTTVFRGDAVRRLAQMRRLPVIGGLAKRLIRGPAPVVRSDTRRAMGNPCITASGVGHAA
jgi:glycosyltransferase involved in cell wall biosynthesis